MIENFKAVQNPLTVIAIFAALAEIAGTIALAAVDKEYQYTFMWFVMAFPTLLVPKQANADGVCRVAS
jgi:hypothetical protein